MQRTEFPTLVSLVLFEKQLVNFLTKVSIQREV